MKGSNLIKVSFCGDIMLLKELNCSMLQNAGGGYNYDEYLNRLKPLFANSDYVVANLETPVSDELPYTDSDFIFNSPTLLLRTLKEVGFKFLSTANNHCLDRSTEGLKQTIENLNKYGFDHCGTSETKEESEHAFIKEVEGIRFAFVCFTFGTNSEHNGNMLSEDELWMVNLFKKQNKPRKFKFNPNSLSSAADYNFCSDDVSPAAITNPVNQNMLERACQQIKEAKEVADIVIAIPHVGGQFNPAPGLYTRHVFDKLKLAGADMVIGSHPHTTLRCEKYNEGRSICAYSLGNLCFTPNVGWYLPNCLADFGVILHVFWNKESKKFVKATFDVTKSVNGDDGMTRVSPVYELYENETNIAARERLLIENEAVVNRFRGRSESVTPQRDYTI